MGTAVWPGCPLVPVEMSSHDQLTRGPREAANQGPCRRNPETKAGGDGEPNSLSRLAGHLLKSCCYPSTERHHILLAATLGPSACTLAWLGSLGEGVYPEKTLRLREVREVSLGTQQGLDRAKTWPSCPAQQCLPRKTKQNPAAMWPVCACCPRRAFPRSHSEP